MDFSLTSEQDELRALTRRILDDHTSTERYKAVLESPHSTDTSLWETLAAAGLIAIHLPESAGGGGLGWIEAAVVLEELGRAAALVPGLAVMAAAPALADHPDLIAGVANGSVVVAAAVHEPLGDPFQPTLTASADGRLTGVKMCVAHGTIADRFVVTAADGLYCVDASDGGVQVERQETTTGVPDAMITFDNASARRIGSADDTAALLRRLLSAATLITSGACQAAVALTATYVKSREQFDRVVASFQAVSQRAGDAYIDTEAVRLTAWQAAWRLAEGLPCDNELLTAKYWSAEGGGRVTRAAHHLHGGVGVDRDYPLHRYYLLHKQLELSFGSATPSLQRLGRLLTTAR